MYLPTMWILYVSPVLWSLVCCYDVPVPDEEIRILLIGKSGAGKSAVGNFILGKSSFLSKMSGQTVTRKVAFDSVKTKGKRLMVVDTPHLYSTLYSKENVSCELAKTYAISSPGIHAFVFVIEAGRFTQEEKITLNFFKNIFGENISDHMILSITWKDKLDHEGITVQEYLDSFPEKSELRTLLRAVDQRYLVFGFDASATEHEAEVTKLITMIDEIMKKNDGNFHSNLMYELVEENIGEFWEKEMEETKEEKVKQMESDLAALKKKQENMNEQSVILMTQLEELQKQRERQMKDETEEVENNFRSRFRRKVERSDTNVMRTVISDLMKVIQELFVIILPQDDAIHLVGGVGPFIV